MAVPAMLDTVAVAGNGLVGHGMARSFAAAGREVVPLGRRDGAALLAEREAGFFRHHARDREIRG